MSGGSGILKVVVFGAAGQTGRLLTERAVADGHQVTAFVRDPARMDLRNGSVRVIQGNVLDSAAVDRAVAGQEAVLVALGTDVVSIVTGNYENAVALLIDLLLIWYLTRPGVRAAFVRVDRAAQGTQGSN